MVGMTTGSLAGSAVVMSEDCLAEMSLSLSLINSISQVLSKSLFVNSCVENRCS